MLTFSSLQSSSSTSQEMPDWGSEVVNVRPVTPPRTSPFQILPTVSKQPTTRHHPRTSSVSSHSASGDSIDGVSFDEAPPQPSNHGHGRRESTSIHRDEIRPVSRSNSHRSARRHDEPESSSSPLEITTRRRSSATNRSERPASERPASTHTRSRPSSQAGPPAPTEAVRELTRKEKLKKDWHDFTDLETLVKWIMAALMFFSTVASLDNVRLGAVTTAARRWC